METANHVVLALDGEIFTVSKRQWDELRERMAAAGCRTAREQGVIAFDYLVEKGFIKLGTGPP